jgi:hypothetical protein
MKQFFKYFSQLALYKCTLKDKTEKNKNGHFHHRKISKLSLCNIRQRIPTNSVQEECLLNDVPKAKANQN